MRIRTLADRLGTTPHAIRFYERRGFLPVPSRGENRYREYAESDIERLRVLLRSALLRMRHQIASKAGKSPALLVVRPVLRGIGCGDSTT